MAQPTVPIDPEWDFHQFHLDVIQDWLASEACQQEKEAGNVEGIRNVKLHGMLHKKALQAQAAQNPAQGKPPSESINYADLPPSGKVQLAAHAGLQLNPAELAQQEALKHAPQPQGAVNA